jgi:uncharacterized membrane protein YebE (DUF533 family)
MEAQPDGGGGTVLALFVVIVAVALWIALRAFIQGLRARKTQAAIGGDFTSFALEALVNAAKLDRRVAESEKRAVVVAMREIDGEAFEAVKVEEAFVRARLSKDELIAYLAQRSSAFSREQKAALLKGLVSVFVADGKFDETEHATLVDYTAAVGFDRQGAPQMLRDIARGNIT